MLGSSIGLSAAEMAGMAEPETVDSFDETDRLVLRYAETSIRDVRIPDALYAELAQRFSQREIYDLGMTVGLASLVNRMHATFRTDIDDDTRDVVGDAPQCPIGR